MLLGLPQFQREEFLAALLTFRALYFLLPLCLAALSLGLRELRMLASAEGTRGARPLRTRERRRLEHARRDCRRLAAKAITHCLRLRSAPSL